MLIVASLLLCLIEFLQILLFECFILLLLLLLLSLLLLFVGVMNVFEEMVTMEVRYAGFDIVD